MAELKILFVDDETAILDGVRDLLRKERHRWSMSFASSGGAALGELEKGGFDIVVTDMRMPGMDGAALLQEVKDRYPEVTRIVLSGHAEAAAVERALPLAQQYLAKPCDAASLRSVITRAVSLRALMSNSQLISMIGSFSSLPTAPSLFLELSKAANDQEVGLSDLAAIVERDPAMSAKILQVANSAFFSLATKAQTVAQATAHLGAQTIRAIALSTQVAQTNGGRLPREFSLENHQSKALTTATLARAFCRDPKDAELAFTVGIILDIGTLVLALGAPKEYGRNRTLMKKGTTSIVEVERTLWGVSHAEVGAYLLGTWGLPATIVDLVRTHHTPNDAPEDVARVALALHVADVIVETKNAPDAPFDWEFLNRCGVATQVNQFQEQAAVLMGPSNAKLGKVKR